ncbi:hypothetical protein BH11PSE4_BH11PSE4_20900 [soil metagenome]
MRISDIPAVRLFPTNIRVVDTSAGAPAPAAAEGGPPPVYGGRPRGCKRLHTNVTVVAVRDLIENSVLTYKQIAAKTGVRAGTVGRWAREAGWQRHPFAPVASDKVPKERAGRRLKLRMLGTQLHQLAERCVREMWDSPAVDLDRLIEAMQVLKMARLEAAKSRRPRRVDHGLTLGRLSRLPADESKRIALAELRAVGVAIDRVPAEAMALLDDAHAERERGPRRGPRKRHWAEGLRPPRVRR